MPLVESHIINWPLSFIDNITVRTTGKQCYTSIIIHLQISK